MVVVSRLYAKSLAMQQAADDAPNSLLRFVCMSCKVELCERELVEFPDIAHHGTLELALVCWFLPAMFSKSQAPASDLRLLWGNGLFFPARLQTVLALHHACST